MDDNNDNLGQIDEDKVDKSRLLKNHRKDSLYHRSSHLDNKSTDIYKKPNIFRQNNILIWKNFKVLLNKPTIAIGHLATMILVCIFIL